MNKKAELRVMELMNRYRELDEHRKGLEKFIATIRYDSVRPVIEEQQKIWDEMKDIVLGDVK